MLVEVLVAGAGALIVLAFVFGSLMAIVPLLMAAVAVPTTFLLVWPLASVTDVSVVIQFLVALVGLGIAIDYALLVVMRWREERRAAHANEAAVAERDGARRPGRRVQRHDGGDRAALARRAAGPVPAQHRHRRPVHPAGQRRGRDHAAAGRARHGRSAARLAARAPRRPRRALWTAWARLVVRHRWAAALASAAVLVALAGAAFSIQLGNPRAESLAQSGPARAGFEKLEASGIGAGPLSPFDALVRGGDPDAVAATLAAVDGVRAAVAPRDWRRDGTALVTVIPAEDGNSAEGRATLDRIRAAAPAGVAVGGQAAQSADFVDVVYGKFPFVVGLIAALTFVLLARAFRSLVLPLKAVAAQPPLGRRRVGRDGARLAERARLGGDLGHRGDARDQRRDPDRRLRVPVRRLDGLPGVHHQPDARGVRPHGVDA